MLKVLVVDDDAGLRFSLRNFLESLSRFSVTEAFDGINALEKIEAENPTFDLILLDMDMPRLNGMATLQKIKEKNPGTIVIILTAHATLNDAILAVKDGAYNYLPKPVENETLLETINKSLQALHLISQATASAPVMINESRRIIGSTGHMQRVFNLVHKLAKVDTPVLVRGASGTGKELVAQAIHFNSSRKEGKFVAINCSAIPENLFESELFGHEKGAFTGADQRKIGKFQYAEGGTLFLDEVGDMPVLMQVKLLRVLQEKKFTPVGSLREFPTNVRIIAATNRPLEEMIKAGTFREDLFYRLNVVPVSLPSLAERKDDIDSMILNFIKKFNEQHSKRITGISSDALKVLKKYNWPGNIRELENVIEHAFVLESGSILTLASLPESLLEATGVSWSLAEESSSLAEGDLDTDDNLFINEDDEPMEAIQTDSALDFNAEKELFEKEFIIKALKTFRGRINQTAIQANIPKKTLLRKIEKYGINAKDYC